MARSVTAASMMTQLEEMVGAENDTHLSAAEKWRILSRAIAATWDKILSLGLGNEFIKKVTFNTTAGTSEYALATIVSAGDFYKVSELYVDEGNGQLRPVSKVSPAEIQLYRAPNQTVPMVLYYHRCAPVWDGSGDEDFDGINGWEEHALLKAAITIKQKKEDDTGPFRAALRECELRMDSVGNRTGAEPPRVVRRRMTAQRDWYYPYRNNVSGWLLRGANLELYYRYGAEP